MKNHRNTGALRLWALVAFLVLVAPNAFADIDTRFPFLAVDTNQINSLWGAFRVQWALFSAFNGGDDGVPAMYYVALAAAMVGAIAVVFNTKAQEFKTIASWLVLVIICLFAPYSSKLLFYKVNEPLVGDGMSTIMRVPGDDNIKGFTPQLAALHVGTTLQVIFIDLFRSARMDSLIDSALGRIALSSSPLMDPGGSWLKQSRDYMRQCRNGSGILPTSLLGSVTANDMRGDLGEGSEPNVSQPSVNASQLTFGNVFDIINQSYAGGTTGLKADYRTPPPAIELYNDFNEAKGNSSYLDGLAKLHNLIFYKAQDVSPNELSNSEKFNEVTEKIITARNGALTRDAYATGSIFFYIKKKGEESDPSSKLQEVRKSMSDCTSWWIGTCDNYYTVPFNKAINADADDNSCAGSDTCGTLSRFMNVPELSKMPVSMFVYSGTNDGRMTGESLESSCDPKRGNSLFESAFQNAKMGPYIFYVKEMIEGTRQLPEPGTWKLEKIGDFDATGRGDAFNKKPYRDLAEKMVNVLNISDRNNSRSANKIDRRLLLAQLYVSTMMEAASINSKSNAQKELEEKYTDMNPSIVGAVGGPMGYMAQSLGSIAAKVGSIFEGAKAVATIYFLRVMIDIVLMAVLILTPIAMLIGIAIPTHAFGILIQSFMIIGILKLVPVTFVIIDRVGSFIYTSLEAVGGPEGELRQALFIYGIAGLYGGLVGMTMFILFKIGDPQNISKLGELDKAAEKAADAGVKLAEGLAKAALNVAKFTVAGGMGGMAAGTEAAKSGAKQVDTMGDELLRAAGGGPVEERKDGPLAPEGVSQFKLREMADEKGLKGAEADEFLANAMAEDEALQEAKLAGFYGSKEDFIAGRAEWDAQQRQIKADEIAAKRAEAQELIERKLGTTLSPDTNKAHSARIDQVVAASMASGGNLKSQQVQDALKAVQGITQTSAGTGTGGGSNATPQVGAMPDPVEGRDTDETARTPYGDRADKTLTGVNTKDIGNKFYDIMKTNESIGRNKYQGVRKILENTQAALDASLGKGKGKEVLQQALGSEYDKISKLRGVPPDNSFLNSAGFYALQGIGGALRPGSGVWTGAMASAGIPYVSDFFKDWGEDSLRAGQRVRAKMASGQTWGQYFEKEKQAKKGEAFNKEVGTQKGGMEYEQNLYSGTDYARGQMVLARKAAAETAAKVADEIRAAMAVRPSGDFSVSDFKGAQLIAAMDNLNKTLQQAAFIQKGSVGLAVPGGKEVQLTDAVLQNLSSGAATWSVAKPVEALFEGHLKGMEKELRYAAKGNDISGRTRGDKSAIAKAASLDMGTDYADLFEINLVEKKAQFTAQAAQAKAYRSLMAMERQMKKAGVKEDVNLPIARINTAAMMQGWERGMMRTYQAVQEIQQDDLQDKIKEIGKMPKRAARYVASKPAIIRQYTPLFRKYGIDDQQTMDKVQDYLDGLTSMRLKAGHLSSGGTRRDALEDLLEHLGVETDKMTQILTDHDLYRL